MLFERREMARDINAPADAAGAACDGWPPLAFACLPPSAGAGDGSIAWPPAYASLYHPLSDPSRQQQESAKGAKEAGANHGLVLYLLEHGADPLWRDPATSWGLEELTMDERILALLRLARAAVTHAARAEALLALHQLVPAAGEVCRSAEAFEEAGLVRARRARLGQLQRRIDVALLARAQAQVARAGAAVGRAMEEWHACGAHEENVRRAADVRAQVELAAALVGEDGAGERGRRGGGAGQMCQQ